MVAHEIHCYFIESNGCLSKIHCHFIGGLSTIGFRGSLAKGWLQLKTVDTPIEYIGCLSKTIYHFNVNKIYHGLGLNLKNRCLDVLKS